MIILPKRKYLLKRFKTMVFSMQISSKSSSSGVKNESENSIEGIDNEDIDQKSKGILSRFFNGKE